MSVRTSIPHCIAASWPEDIAPSRFASTIRSDTPEGCTIALLGLADDLGVRLNGGRPGAREGPRAFRAALSKYGVAQPRPPAFPRVFDAGDVVPAPGDDEAALATTHERVMLATHALLDLELFPIAIGGGHDLTYPFVRAAIEHVRAGEKPARKKPCVFGGIYFDAHLDVRAAAGSGMPFRRLIEDCGVGPLAIVGSNPLANSDEHQRYFRAHHGVDCTTLLHDHKPLLAPLRRATHLFCSFDMDVLDAAFAPGVSAPNPIGISSRLAADALAQVLADPRVRCLDFMELCPAHDDQGRTSTLAAALFLHALRAMPQRPRAQPKGRA